MTRVLSVVMAGFGLTSCMVGEPATTTTGEDRPSFEEFERTIYHEPFEGGVYIVNGDEPIVNSKRLEEYYEMLYSNGALIVHQVGGTDAKWNSTQRKNLTYCVSNNFGSNKSRIVTAMNEAAGAWEQVADVNFIHVTAQDASCSASNNNVLFDVSPMSGSQYLARAFFPGDPRSSRNVMVDNSAFGSNGAVTLRGIITHELGHTLGFRHEHTRPESGKCFEDNNWRSLTTYDAYSVMHYPHCNGANTGDLAITAKDKAGAEALYGPPGGGGGDPPPPPPPSGGNHTDTKQGSVAQNEVDWYGPITVTAGTRFTAKMSGTGDPDLYLRFGGWPNSYQFHCRPYLDGADETCDLDVPAGQTQAYFLVHGYTAATYRVDLTWTGP